MEAAGDTRCWCTQLPPLPLNVSQQTTKDAVPNRCFCPDCLRTLLAAAPKENH
jgi:hypothetical protein